MIRAIIFCMLIFLLFGARETVGQEWFKGNLHMHTLWSDGDAAPEYAAAWYKDNGWDFICFTDHNILLEGETFKPIADESVLTPDCVDALREQFGDDWVETREQLGRLRMRLKTFEELRAHFEAPGSFLLMQGEELTTLGGSPHVNAINSVERIGGLTQDDIAVVTDEYMASIEAQAEAHGRPIVHFLCHPNWSDAVTIEEAIKIERLRYFEVYNGHPAVNNWGHEEHGYPTTDRIWDVVLSMRLKSDPGYFLYGLATDDAHNYHRMGRGANPGRGWVMVRAEALETEALLAAIKAGEFYASTGVSLDNITRNASGISFDIIATPGVSYTTRFIGTRRGFNTESEPVLCEDGEPKPRASRQYSDEIGVVLAETTDTSPSYAFTGDELYVRAKVVSDTPHPNPFREGDTEMAWVQPAIVGQLQE